MATLTTVLGIIALTAWAAVATSVFHGPWAVLAAAVLTALAALAALAAVAAGYVPLIHDGVLHRRRELERLEAEGEADQQARAVATDAGPVRVLLLLARSAGEWRDRLAAAEPAVRELLAAAGGEEPLTAAVSGELTNADLVRAAAPIFAAELGIPAPERVLVDVGRRVVRVLDLHAAALVAVLRSPRLGGTLRVRVGDVLDELLGHEADLAT